MPCVGTERPAFGHGEVQASATERRQPRLPRYRHPTNIALFLGDLIDRGPQQLECIRIPRMMRDAGSAKILMGNHEFNAIAYATPTDDGKPVMSKKDRLAAVVWKEVSRW